VVASGAVLLLSVSTGNKLGLGLIGLAVVVFALVASMVIPRRHPDFPGRHLGGFLTLCVCFFAAMLFAVFFFGKETHAGIEALGEAPTTTVEKGAGADTNTGPTAPAPTATTTTTATETETETEDAGGDHCATDPTGLSDEQLAAMNHGSIVCWAAHQTSWPGYDNHGAFVSHWAHAGKDKTSQGKSAWGHSHKP